MLKKIGIVVLTILALILIGGKFVPTKQYFEKSVTIKASNLVIWDNISTFEKRQAWSPWKVYDPNMKTSLSGEDGKKGATFSWESDHERVGVGSQTFTLLDKANYLETKMIFKKPHEGEGNSFMNLNVNSDGCEVKWGFSFEIPYPINAIMAIMPEDKSIDKDFTNGLMRLKDICESQH